MKKGDDTLSTVARREKRDAWVGVAVCPATPPPQAESLLGIVGGELSGRLGRRSLRCALEDGAGLFHGIRDLLSNLIDLLFRELQAF